MVCRNGTVTESLNGRPMISGHGHGMIADHPQMWTDQRLWQLASFRFLPGHLSFKYIYVHGKRHSSVPTGELTTHRIRRL